MNAKSPSPMRADARRNRARVLEAAQEAFAADGLLVPLDEIARRAKVGPGTVYRHFPTKEALFDAVILHRVQSLVDRARELAGAADPGPAFFAFIAEMTQASAAKRDLIDALAGAGIDVTASLAEANRELWECVGELLARAQQADAVRRDIGTTEVRVLLRSVFIATQQEKDSQRLTARVMEVVSDGLRAPTAGG